MEKEVSPSLPTGEEKNGNATFSFSKSYIKRTIWIGLAFFEILTCISIYYQ